MAKPGSVATTTITGQNQISLPTRYLRRLGWQRGDQLVVEILGKDMLLLFRRPTSWADFCSGRLGDVFADHEGTLRYLEEERQSWERS